MFGVFGKLVELAVDTAVEEVVGKPVKLALDTARIITKEDDNERGDKASAPRA